MLADVRTGARSIETLLMYVINTLLLVITRPLTLFERFNLVTCF